MRTVKELKEAQSHTAADVKAAKKQAKEADANSAQAKATAEEIHLRTKKPVKAGWLDGDGYFQHKPGDALTFQTPNGEITAYGQFDVSADYLTKNAGSSLQLNGASPPIGNFGWMPDLATNGSYLGVRGFQRLGDRPTHFVYQLEVGMGITTTPGLKQSNSNLSDTTDGTLFNRNTWIGFSDPGWGAIKVGKSSSPYMSSTSRFNPFGGEIGTYGSIMGNSGGDNRVEFGTRIDHAIWYESPRFLGGFDFKFMFAPGQNRADNSDNIAAGESDCAGGNDPTSGGNPLVSCSDGSFSNLLSTSLSYTNGPFYITGAYEWHVGIFVLQTFCECFDRIIAGEIWEKVRGILPRPQHPKSSDFELLQYWREAFSVVFVGVCDDNVIDEVSAINIPNARSDGRSRASVTAIHKMHGPGIANLVSNGDCVTAFRGMDLQKVQLIIIGHVALKNRMILL